MTSEKAQIQALLNGIDEVLNKTSPRLPWVMSGDAVQQRQILEQTRQYLIQLQQQLDENPMLLSSPGLNAPAGFPAAAPGQSPSESAQQVLQAVLQEMNYWRVNMLQPLRSEIDSLQRQREMLTQELRQLEIQRQQYGLPQQNQKLMMEFLQSAMLQMQANLSAQVSQMVAAAQPQLTQMGDGANAAERTVQLQTAQTQSDQVMLKLDATIQRIFESLSRNLQTYEASLEQGLQRMHDLGQQGESMYAFLMNRMAQQLGREASSMLQSGQPTSDQPTLSSPAPDAAPEFAVNDFLSQVPPAPAPVSSVPFNLSEDVLDIAALDEAEMAAATPPPADNLEALHQELNRLELAPLSGDLDVSLDQFAADLFSGDQPLAPPLSGPSTPAMPSAATDDFDSALDLLNQLSAEMQADSSLTAMPAVSPDSSPAVPDQPAPATEFVSTLDSLYGDDTPLDAAPPSPPPIDAATLAQEWFGGLGDPAEQSQPASASIRPQFADGSVSQSLESFLRNDAPPLVENSDFVIQEQETAAAEAPETISSLFDLLPETTAPAAPPSPELPVQEAAPEYGVDLGNSLQEFQRDFPVNEAAANPVLEGGWEVFSDLPTAVSHPSSGLPAPQPPPQPPAAPVESLDGLFAEVPDLNSANTVPSPAQVLSDLFAQFQPNAADTEPPDSEKKN